MLLTVVIQQNVDIRQTLTYFVVFPKQLPWRKKTCDNEQILVASSDAINYVTTNEKYLEPMG